MTDKLNYLLIHYKIDPSSSSSSSNNERSLQQKQVEDDVQKIRTVQQAIENGQVRKKRKKKKQHASNSTEESHENNFCENEALLTSVTNGTNSGYQDDDVNNVLDEWVVQTAEKNMNGVCSWGDDRSDETREAEYQEIANQFIELPNEPKITHKSKKLKSVSSTL